MPIKYLLLTLITVFMLQGCETVKGFKKDVDHIWGKLKNADNEFSEDYW